MEGLIYPAYLQPLGCLYLKLQNIQVFLILVTQPSPIVAAVASDEPQIAPNPAQAPIAAIATPPFLCPRHAPVNLKSASLIPALPAKFPINKNSGMTDKE